MGWVSKNIYLLRPYNDIIKVNALTDSAFLLHLNGGIVYTKADLYTKMETTPKMFPEEDDITRYMRFITATIGTVKNRVYNSKNSSNVFEHFNSYNDYICGGNAMYIYSMLYSYLSGGQTFCGTFEEHGHCWNEFANAHLDKAQKCPIYKDIYLAATRDEILSDPHLFVEPLRVLMSDVYDSWRYGLIDAGAPYSGYVNSVDNLQIKMPGGSNFVFPYAGTNEVYADEEIGGTLINYANLLLTIPATITGDIEMPFALLRVNGTGSIRINETEYSLPDDEESVLTALQLTYYTDEVWFNKFTVLTNTDGITAEFLVNPYNCILERNNLIEYNISSGSISFERYRTSNPIKTFVLSVDKRDALSFTTNFNKWFYTNKSLRLPLYPSTQKRCFVTFNNNSGNSIPNIFVNATKDSVTGVSADIKNEKCWASKLMPRSDSFSESLELSFVTIDDSDIYYTTDESDPDETDTKYTAPFTITETTTIKWINIKEGYADSHINTRVITKS